MKIIPFEKFSLSSRLSKEELVAKLKTSVRPLSIIPPIFRPQDSIKIFAGKVKEKTFSIQRIINYRNSFVPMAKGEIIEVHGGTQINLILRPHLLVILFMIHWCSIVIGICSLSINEIVTQGFHPALVIPFGMLIFAILMMSYGFNRESKETKKYLKEILEGKEVNSYK